MLPSFSTRAHQEIALRNSLLHRYRASADILPETLLDVATRELCRFGRVEQCATLFARWTMDRPGSPRLKAGLTEARKSGRDAREKLTPQNLKSVQMLFNGKVRDVPEAARVQQAERLTDRFLRYYHHAVPFDRRVIDAAWRRCHGEDCDERQKSAWASLGSPEEKSATLSDSAVPSDPAEPASAWGSPDEESDAGTLEVE